MGHGDLGRLRRTDRRGGPSPPAPTEATSIAGSCATWVVAVHLVPDGGQHYWIERVDYERYYPQLTDDAALKKPVRGAGLRRAEQFPHYPQPR